MGSASLRGVLLSWKLGERVRSMHTERGALPKPARRDDVPISGPVYSNRHLR